MELTALMLRIRYEGEELLGVFAASELAEEAARNYIENRGYELDGFESFVYLSVNLNELR
jgi:hypothetical protein